MMKKIFYILILLSFLIWGIGFVLFAWYINAYQGNDNVKTEAVVALTGGRNRIAKAVEILNNNKADILFISGVDRDSSWKSIKERQHLVVNDGKQVVLGKKAKDTIGNAKETIDWLRENKIKSIRLVTSNYHLPRSIAEFRALDKTLKIEPNPVYSEKVQKKWWKSWHTFSLIFKEYNKFLCVYVRCCMFK